jgi:hypothetical protein
MKDPRLFLENAAFQKMPIFRIAGVVSALPVTHPRRLFVPKNELKTALSRH